MFVAILPEISKGAIWHACVVLLGSRQPILLLDNCRCGSLHPANNKFASLASRTLMLGMREDQNRADEYIQQARVVSQCWTESIKTGLRALLTLTEARRIRSVR